MKKIFILLLFVVSACGYQPLYKVDVDNDIIEIKEIEIIGDVILGKNIFSKLPLQIKKNNKSLNKLIINSKKNIIETSKNSKGQISSYRMSLTVTLKILDNKNNIIKEKTVNKDFAYNSKSNKFRLKEYQNEIEKNLINRVSENLIIYLNL